MKMYKIRKTGEMVEVLSYTAPLGTHRSKEDNVSYIDSRGEEHPSEAGNIFWDFKEVAHEKDFTSKISIDWEQRRYEIAKGALQGYLSCYDGPSLVGEHNYQYAAEASVKFADAIISELKKGEEPAQTKQEEKEVQIGDIIEVDGEKYICCEASPEQDCSCCDLCKDDDCKRPYGNCSSDYRKDGKNLTFKKI